MYVSPVSFFAWAPFHIGLRPLLLFPGPLLFAPFLNLGRADLRELFGGIRGLAGPVEVLDAHPVGVKIAAIGVAVAGESVVGVGPAAVRILANVVFHCLAGMRGYRRRVGVRLCCATEAS